MRIFFTMKATHLKPLLQSMCSKNNFQLRVNKNICKKEFAKKYIN